MTFLQVQGLQRCFYLAARLEPGVYGFSEIGITVKEGVET